jgi:hypothetical protein
VVKDCQTCHSALSKKKKGEYSEGTTFWLPHKEGGRCSIENIVKEIYNFHTRGVKFDA